MSKKQWMVLLMLFLTYLLLGAAMFYFIERPLESERVAQDHLERMEINAMLNAYYRPYEKENHTEILDKLTQYCGKPLHNVTEDKPLKWDFYSSFYFAYTVVSTIGYGNLAPTNTLSRMLMIFYALVGIPMNGILLAQLGEFFSIVFVRAHRKYKSYKQNHEDDCKKKLTQLETHKAGLAMQILMYLVPGFLMFIFFPAILFSYVEGWKYDESVYYAFVTLTTIGFGDYVAGQADAKGSSGILVTLYKIFLIAWISFGLGYIVMIMTFITRGMRSKRIIRLEHKLAMNIKQTQSKIWSEFNKEVGYLRRVFNELQLSRVKRVYMDKYDEVPTIKFMRSSSFPDLRQLVYGGLASSNPVHPRRRANSEVVPIEVAVGRVVSETDLQRIDKTATFATHAMVQPAELLARLVNILGYMPPMEDDDEPSEPLDSRGVQGFSDNEILSSERGLNECGWKLGGGSMPRKPRSRTVSEVRLDPAADLDSSNQEWTWSGPAASIKIQELIKARKSAAARKDNSNANSKDFKSMFTGLPKSVPLPRWIRQFSRKADDSDRNAVSVGDLASDDMESNLTEQSTYFTHTGTPNLSATLESSNLLEETSLADFLRALTAVHSRVGAVPEEFVKKPQRKMGTACLTPPKLPSLLALFSPLGSASVPPSNQNTITTNANMERRFSLRAAEDTCSNLAPMYSRRTSLVPTSQTKIRRFSLRPVINTPQTMPFLTNLARESRASPPPPAYSTDSYVYECPKKPLVPMERGPGVSSPIASAAGFCRSSLRMTHTDLPPGPNGAVPIITKGMPRWRAGMLQRQLNNISLHRRRVRAHSLGDVVTMEKIGGNDRATGNVVSPLAQDPGVTTTTIATKDGNSKNMTSKTVTIVSPGVKVEVPFRRAVSTFNTNPFVIDMSPSETEQTVFQALNEVKNINAVPTMTQNISLNRAGAESSTVINNIDSPVEKCSSLRKNSIVSVGYWAADRKISTLSEHSSVDSAPSSRKSSTKSLGDKPCVSESYKTLLEVDYPCERYNSATASLDKSKESNSRFTIEKISTGLDDENTSGESES